MRRIRETVSRRSKGYYSKESSMRTPEQCAAYMVWRYKSRKAAIEIANGYASGLYYEQSETARAYWRAVLDELAKLKTIHE